MSVVRHSRLLILGSGPAGYSAAVYSARANRAPLLITGLEQGGQLMTTTEVDNWPGDVEHLQGLLSWIGCAGMPSASIPRLSSITSIGWTCGAAARRRLRRAANGRPCLFVCSATTANTPVTRSSSPPARRRNILGCRRRSCIAAKVSPRAPPAMGFFYRGKAVAVVGGGNTAVEEALYLTNIASHVTLIHRRDRLKSEKILQDRLFALEKSGKVSILWNHAVEEIVGDAAGVIGARVRSTTHGGNAAHPQRRWCLHRRGSPTEHAAVRAPTRDAWRLHHRQAWAAMATPRPPACRAYLPRAMWPIMSTARP